MTAPPRSWPVLVGAVAAALLLAFYLSIVTLAEGRERAAEQFRADLPYLAFLFPGFGTQMGLYTRLRQLVHARQRAGAVAGASGGMSATAVVACCAHFLPTLLPILGISALSAALAAWKAPLLVVAILMNAAGALYAGRLLRRHGRMLAAPVA